MGNNDLEAKRDELGRSLRDVCDGPYMVFNLRPPRLLREYSEAVNKELEGLRGDVRQREAAFERTDKWLKAMTANRDELFKDNLSYREQIGMYQQNERAYAVREKELMRQNDALRKANASIHNARLDDLTDIKILKEQVRKLGQDLQGLLNPVEIVEPLENRDPTCNCNSCKWERHQETIKSSRALGYGINTTCVVCGRQHNGLHCPTMIQTSSCRPLAGS